VTACGLLFVKKSALRCISLLLIAVAASLLKVSVLFPSVVLTDISLTLFTAIAEALLRPLIIVCVLTPCSTCSFTSFKISPASTTTDVVPSPTSASCERAMSVNIRAAGWTISSNYQLCQQKGNVESEPQPTFMTVAPSLVIVCLPFASTIKRSPPYGPSVLFMVDCTARHALMLEMTCPFP
jgi:hypothetical protein